MKKECIAVQKKIISGMLQMICILLVATVIGTIVYYRNNPVDGFIHIGSQMLLCFLLFLLVMTPIYLVGMWLMLKISK